MDHEESIDPVFAALTCEVDLYPHEILNPQPEDDCPTCKEPFKLNELDHCRAIRLIECGHIVGDRCLEAWLRVQPDRCLNWNHKLNTMLSKQHPIRAQHKLIAEMMEIGDHFDEFQVDNTEFHHWIQQSLLVGTEHIAFPGNTRNTKFGALAQNRLTKARRGPIRRAFITAMAHEYSVWQLMLYLHFSIVSLLPFIVWAVIVAEWKFLWPTVILVTIGVISVPPPIRLPSMGYFQYVVRLPCFLWFVFAYQSWRYALVMLEYLAFADGLMDWAIGRHPIT
jgi:hypothetical protein